MLALVVAAAERMLRIVVGNLSVCLAILTWADVLQGGKSHDLAG